jgi:hypothetical protein
LQQQGGGKHVMYYDIYAHGRDGRKLLVGEGFRGASQADAAIRLIGRELGLAGIDKRGEPETGASAWDPAGLLRR